VPWVKTHSKKRKVVFEVHRNSQACVIFDSEPDLEDGRFRRVHQQQDVRFAGSRFKPDRARTLPD